MGDITRVALDAMGGDNAPHSIVQGAIDAVNERDDIKVFLVGKVGAINGELSKYTFPAEQIEVVEATEEIEMAEPPVNAIKKKKDSSMVVGMKLVKDGKADAFVTAGNSGAVLVGGQTVVGRIRGIKRAPFAPLIPTKTGVSLLLDCGANVDARAGAEEEKGNALVKETFPLLKECTDINFIGSVESREIPEGGCDVIVCEAFVGNVILKLYEGLAGTLISVIKEGLMSTTKSKIGALLAKPALKKTLKSFDASTYGGAPLLGLEGLVVKTHGSATNTEVKNSIIQCVAFKEQDIANKVRESIANDSL